MADSKWKYNVEIYQQKPALNDRGKLNHITLSTISEADRCISLYYFVNVFGESDERRFCFMESESLVHLFWYRHIISIFRMQVQKFCLVLIPLFMVGWDYSKEDFYHRFNNSSKKRFVYKATQRLSTDRFKATQCRFSTLKCDTVH